MSINESPKSQHLDDDNTMAITTWSGLLDSHILSIISPYLHPIDLLHLSTCCKDLTSCRCQYLSKIKTRGSRSSAVLNRASALGHGGLYRLLSQPFNRLASLDLSGRADIIKVIAAAMRKGTFPQLNEIVMRCHRGGDDVLPIMEALSEGSCPNIKVLGLEGRQPGQALGQAMRSHALANLEQLTLSGNPEWCGGDIMPIMEALSEGSCPNIKVLGLTERRVGHPAATALANAIISGYLIHLQRLDLNRAFADPEASFAVIQAIGRPEVTPDLTHLNLTETNMRSQHGQALGEAMRSQALTNLEVLVLENNYSLGDDGMVAIMEALSEGSCPKIKVLGLTECRVGQASATALAIAIISGHLIHLQRLDLNRVFAKPVDSLAVIQAIGQPGATPDLTSLNLTNTQMKSQHGQALGEAMRSQALTNLKELVLSSNPGLSDDGVLLPIMEALSEGSCPNIKVLDLEECRMGQAAAIALANAIISGYLIHLQRLILNRALVDPVASFAVIQAIGHATPDLIHLNLISTNMTSQHGQALGQAMRNQALTNMKELVLSSNPDLGDDGMVPIMEALSEGSCPYLKKLILEDVGMLQASGQALARALTSGHLHQLQYLSIHQNNGIGDEAMAAIIPALGQLRGSLVDMNISHAGVGDIASKALVDALLHGGWWPRLEKLGLSVRASRLDRKVWNLTDAMKEGGNFPSLTHMKAEFTSVGSFMPDDN